MDAELTITGTPDPRPELDSLRIWLAQEDDFHDRTDITTGSELGDDTALVVTVPPTRIRRLAQTIADWLGSRRTNVEVSIQVDAVHLRVTAKGLNTRQAEVLAALVASELHHRTMAAPTGSGGLGPTTPATVESTFAVSIYLGDGSNHEAVEAAVTAYLAEHGLEVFGHEAPVIGSWFRRFWARTKQETAHLTPSRLGAEAERKVRIEVFDKDQAAIDNLVAVGMAALITSLQGETDACVRAGAILVLKVDGRLYSTTLFQYQLAWLERNQVLLQDPEGLLKGLDALGTGEAQGAIEQPPHAA